MAKSLIIGGASNYGWNELKYLVNSIKKTGFDGDICLVATNITKETIERLVKEGVKLSLYGQEQPDGSYKAQSNGMPHVERFFYIWNTLSELQNEYEYVIAIDTRDVVFQTNPVYWLDEKLSLGKKLVVSSEGLKYRDEPWGNNNLRETFGPYFHNRLKDNTIYNVGTIAGFAKEVTDLMLLIFQFSINRPIPIVDQAVFNFLIQQEPFKSNILFTDNKSGWAIQLGTTLEAVKSGKGDLGINYGSDPSKHINYQMLYDDIQPRFNEGLVLDQNDNKYCIVHQYDRTLKWSKEIMEKYDD